MTEDQPSAEKTVDVSCECGKRYRLRSTAVGKKAKCACGRIFTITVTPPAEKAERPGARATVPGDDVDTRLTAIFRPWFDVVIAILFCVLWIATVQLAPHARGPTLGHAIQAIFERMSSSSKVSFWVYLGGLCAFTAWALVSYDIVFRLNKLMVKPLGGAWSGAWSVSAWAFPFPLFCLPVYLIVRRTVYRDQILRGRRGCETPSPQTPASQAAGPALSTNAEQVPSFQKPASQAAVVSLVLGLVAFPFVWLVCMSLPCAILAIVFGVAARNKAKRGEAGGSGVATAGLVLGIISLSATVLYHLVLFLVVLRSSGRG